jgi:hypothetical protein
MVSRMSASQCIVTIGSTDHLAQVKTTRLAVRFCGMHRAMDGTDQESEAFQLAIDAWEEISPETKEMAFVEVEQSEGDSGGNPGSPSYSAACGCAVTIYL